MAQTLESIFLQGSDQERLDHTPGSALTIGEIISMGGIVGCVTSPEGIAASALGAVAVKGIFRILKDGTAGPTFAQGVQVDWDNTNKLAVAAGTGDFTLGVCTKAALTGDDGVEVKINEVILA